MTRPGGKLKAENGQHQYGDDGTGERNRTVILYSAIVSLTGVIAFLIAQPHIHPVSYTIVGASGAQVGDRLVPHAPSEWWTVLSDLGLALVSIGLVGVVLELAGRSAQERVYRQMFEDSSGRVGTEVSRQTLHAILGDPEFVRNILGSERRGELIRQLIVAGLNSNDPSASYLAGQAASQLSGEGQLTLYDVTYTIVGRHDSDEKGHSTLRQAFRSNERPNHTFAYHFLVFDQFDDAKTVNEPEGVFTWRWWLKPGQELSDVQDELDVEKVEVNGVRLDRMGEEETAEEKKQYRRAHPRAGRSGSSSRTPTPATVSISISTSRSTYRCPSSGPSFTSSRQSTPMACSSSAFTTSGRTLWSRSRTWEWRRSRYRHGTAP